MTSAMQWVCFAMILALSCIEGQAQDTPASSLLKVRAFVGVPGEKVHDGMTISVPYRECGYIFCDAPDVYLNSTTQFWDYYIDWKMPETADNDPNVFVLANRYQMPRSYLVFKGFTTNFTGEYSCRLHFRREVLVSFSLTLAISSTATSRDCSNTATP